MTKRNNMHLLKWYNFHNMRKKRIFPVYWETWSKMASAWIFSWTLFTVIPFWIAGIVPNYLPKSKVTQVKDHRTTINMTNKDTLKNIRSKMLSLSFQGLKAAYFLDRYVYLYTHIALKRNQWSEQELFIEEKKQPILILETH